MDYGLQIWPIHSKGPSELKPMKHFGEKGVWAYPGTAQIFWVPPTISGTRKATIRTSNLAGIHRVHANKSPWKIWEKRDAYPRTADCPNCSSRPTPYYLRNGTGKARTSNLASIFTGSIRTKAWAYSGTVHIFEYPIISGTDKATNFDQFCTHILSIDRNKSPLQISGKVAVGRGLVRTLEIFSGHPYIGRIARSSLR